MLRHASNRAAIIFFFDCEGAVWDVTDLDHWIMMDTIHNIKETPSESCGCFLIYLFIYIHARFKCYTTHNNDKHTVSERFCVNIPKL